MIADLIDCRAYSIQRHVPITLSATIGLPETVDLDSSASIMGFRYMIEVYRLIDDRCIGLWINTRDDFDASSLVEVQKKLATVLPEDLDTTQGQAADLRVSQQ